MQRLTHVSIALLTLKHMPSEGPMARKRVALPAGARVNPSIAIEFRKIQIESPDQFVLKEKLENRKFVEICDGDGRKNRLTPTVTIITKIVLSKTLLINGHKFGIVS